MADQLLKEATFRHDKVHRALRALEDKMEMITFTTTYLKLIMDFAEAAAGVKTVAIYLEAFII